MEAKYLSAMNNTWVVLFYGTMNNSFYSFLFFKDDIKWSLAVPTLGACAVSSLQFTKVDAWRIFSAFLNIKGLHLVSLWLKSYFLFSSFILGRETHKSNMKRIRIKSLHVFVVAFLSPP